MAEVAQRQYQKNILGHPDCKRRATSSRLDDELGT